MDSRWARVARGWSAAAFATFVAALSHTLAGGEAPTLFGVGASLLLSALLCTVLTTRTLSLWRLVLSMAASQVMFHSLFSSLGTPVAVAHDHSSTVMLADVTSHEHSSMWLAHVVAGAITIVSFRYAESAFWGLSATARLFFARFIAFAVPVLGTPVRLVFSFREPVALPLRELLSPMRHRGPPVEWAAV